MFKPRFYLDAGFIRNKPAAVGLWDSEHDFFLENDTGNLKDFQME